MVMRKNLCCKLRTSSYIAILWLCLPSADSSPSADGSQLANGSQYPQRAKLQNKVLQIGTKVAPPFSMKTTDGKWQGISIELWEKIAKQLQLEFVWKEKDLKTLLSGVQNSELDVSIAALTITADREKRIDFSHAYYSTGLSIAVPRVQNSGWRTVIKGILSFKLLILLLLYFQCYL